MTNQLKVVQNFSGSKLVENMQRTKLRYAFAKQVDDTTFECLMPFVQCRDYMKDVLYMNFMNDKKPLGIIHGFDTNNPKLLEIEVDRTVLVLKADPTLLTNILKHKDYLEKVEKKFGAELTQFIEVSVDEMVVIGDKRWQNSLLGISYYTFLFRWMAAGLTKPSQYEDTAEDVLIKNASSLEKVAKSIDDINYKKFIKPNLNGHSVHNHYGLYYLGEYPELFC